MLTYFHLFPTDTVTFFVTLICIGTFIFIAWASVQKDKRENRDTDPREDRVSVKTQRAIQEDRHD